MQRNDIDLNERAHLDCGPGWCCENLIMWTFPMQIMLVIGIHQQCFGTKNW